MIIEIVFLQHISVLQLQLKFFKLLDGKSLSKYVIYHIFSANPGHRQNGILYQRASFVY